MTSSVRFLFAPCILALIGTQAAAQTHAQRAQPVPAPAARPPIPAALPSALPSVPSRPPGLMSTVTLADIGFGSGLRFANLGGRRDVFVPLPPALDGAASALVLALDDISAHDARRSLEVLINDRSAAAIVLDGRSTNRLVRVPVATGRTGDGFLKLSFIYSGAATQDRCIDVRYVGDSLTIRPDSAVELDIGGARALDVATTVALMPRDVAIVLPGRKLTPSDITTALTVARALAASGRRVSFHHGAAPAAEAAARANPNRWTRGLVFIGTPDDVTGRIELPAATIAGPPAWGTLVAVRADGAPALLISDDAAARAGRLLASPSLAATRGLPAATVGQTAAPQLPADRISFDQLGLAPVQADVFGRADLVVAVDTRRLPPGTYPTRLALDVMIAPDGAGEKAVVSTYVNERLLGSTVAAASEPTRLDLPLPPGLVGTNANIRLVVQRRSAQGDCRFEPQGYPAQILGSSALVLASADGRAADFSDLTAQWGAGVEVLAPLSIAERPAPALGLLADVLNVLSPESARINVTLVDPSAPVVPAAPFLALSDKPPAGSTPRVRFDRGRVAVDDRSGRTLLDLGGFATGAVAQIVSAGKHPGLWIKPLAADGALPNPAELRLDHGDVAFIDRSGVALAMSTERDTLMRITYPDQVSWLTVAERFRSWIIGGLWLLGTVVFLFVLQRMFRRRPRAASK